MFELAIVYSLTDVWRVLEFLKKDKEKRARGQKFVRIAQHHPMDFNIPVTKKVWVWFGFVSFRFVSFCFISFHFVCLTTEQEYLS